MKSTQDMQNHEKLEMINLATKLVFEVLDSLVPDFPVSDQDYDEIDGTGFRIVSDLERFASFVEDSPEGPSSKRNGDIP